jgi:hypothetical protein
MNQVLIFLGRDNGFLGWLRLDADAVERGESLESLVLAPDDRVVAVAPGD